MNKALLIPLLAFSCAFGDDFQFLPPKPQEKNPVENQSIELDLFGFSHHSNPAPHYNSTNPGEGITYAYSFNPPKDHVEFIASVGTYKDSMNNRARFGLVGLRFLIIGDPKSFNATFSFSVGPYRGSGIPSVGIIPVISLGYDKFSVGVIGGYSKDSNSYNADGSISKTNSSTSVIAVFADIKILTW